MYVPLNQLVEDTFSLYFHKMDQQVSYGDRYHQSILISLRIFAQFI